MQKIPFIGVVGNKELEIKSVAVRARGNKDLGVMTIDNFIGMVKEKNVPGINEL
jgi:threonyl-tRNA synthetase